MKKNLDSQGGECTFLGTKAFIFKGLRCVDKKLTKKEYLSERKERVILGCRKKEV